MDAEVILPKGGADIEEHVLFGKYRLCRRLGVGRSGTVFLVWHTELEEYRAMKVVPKTMSDYESFKKEALFLKTLRHPGIPLVYDVEEDLHNSYLIEEYLEGESLYALVKRLGSLSMKTATEIGIQICRLIQFMNTADNPILYLDLQPKNLLVCNGTVRLIDFDHAQYAKNAAAFGIRYGTIGFAAPEQYRGEPLDCRTDVYAIGALLYFMYFGKIPEREFKFGEQRAERSLNRILSGCMAEKKEERYRDAGTLMLALKELAEGEEGAIEPLTIVFAGAARGIGTTHCALAISDFMIRNGYQALYREDWDTDTVRILAKRMKKTADKSGLFHIGRLYMRPYYGEAVRLLCGYFPIVIRDTGCLWMDGAPLPEAAVYVLVCGSRPWETESVIRGAKYFTERGNTILLFNHTEEKFRPPAEFKEYVCLNMPFLTDPFKKNSDADACFGNIMEIGTGGIEKWKKERKRRRFLRRKPV